MIAAIAIGSNLPSRFGDPAGNLREALRRLAGLGTLLGVSSFHHTAPVGPTSQPFFTNAAALLQTSRLPLPLLRALLAIEAAMGRVRSADLPLKGPRILDLDLLLFQEDGGQSLVLVGPELTLPHPSLHERRFVLAPLAEIAPDLQHPVCHKTISELLAQLP